MKKYKTYFSKEDTPYRKDFQPDRKYHVVWKRNAYESFLGHKVVKVKLFGIFNIMGKGSPSKIIEGYINQNLKSEK